MSDTPRTDSYTAQFGWVVPADFARILERELAAVTAEWDAARASVDKLAAMVGRTPEMVSQDGDSPIDAARRQMAEISRLRAKLAERDAEVEKYKAELRVRYGAELAIARKEFAAEQPRTEAEWKAADRRKRINGLAARYAGQLMAGNIAANDGWQSPESIAADARALAAAVVEAEE